MASHASSDTKTIREAVEDGTLIDVSEAAKSKGLECKTFLCASFWEKTLGRSEEKLTSVLKSFAGIYNFFIDYTHYGPMHAPGLLRYGKNTHEQFCTGILEPNDELGLVLVIVAYRTENELKLVR